VCVSKRRCVRTLATRLSLRASWLFAVPGFPMSSRCSPQSTANNKSRTCVNET